MPGVGKRSQPERKATTGGWKDAFREAFKWKARAGKAVRARTQPTHAAMRPLAKGRVLTPDEVRKLIAPVLQPVRAKYGGQGFAKPSAFVDIASDDKDAVIRALYDEHVDGFSGKSYKKMGNAQDMMEWRVRLKAKAEREGTAEPRAARRREPEPDAELRHNVRGGAHARRRRGGRRRGGGRGGLGWLGRAEEVVERRHGGGRKFLALGKAVLTANR